MYVSNKIIKGYKIYMNNMLGQGSFGDVYIGVSNKTGEKVAVKILSKLKSKLINNLADADEYLQNALFNEIKVMESIKS